MRPRTIVTIMTICSVLVLGVLLTLEASNRARADILGWSMGAVKISPPIGVQHDCGSSGNNCLESNSQVRAFDERQKVKLGSSLSVNVLNPPATDSPPCTVWKAAHTQGGSIPAGHQISSHLLHADRVGDSPTVTLDGRVTFDKPIIGVMFLHTALNNSDGSLGAISGNPSGNTHNTLYPVSNPAREFEDFIAAGTSEVDQLTINCSATRTVDVIMHVNDDMDQIRVITDENDDPTCTGPNVTTAENTMSSTFSLGCSDPETPGPADTITCSVVTQGTKGTLSITNCGSAKYTPNANMNGSDTVTYRASDPWGGTVTATVNVTITPFNSQPVANNGAGGTTTWTSPNPPISVAIDLGALVSDVETADANLTYAIDSGPANGGLTGSGTTRSYTPNSGFSGTDSFTFHVTDRGDPDNCGAPSSSCAAAKSSVIRTVTITVSSNTPPSASDGTASFAEGGSVGIDLGTLVSDVETSDANLTYTIDSSPSSGALTGAGQNWTYTPTDPDFFGTDSFTYHVTDRGKPDNCGVPSPTCAAVQTSVTRVVNITVSPVNDVPSFTKGSDQALLEDAGPQSIPGWATLISAGPANESGQAVDFIVNNDNNALFSVQPAIAADGMLTYTAATDANGDATVTMKIHDDGGTTGGGVDTSAEQTFDISVTPVNDAPTFTAGPGQKVLENGGPQSVPNWATSISPGPADEAGQVLDVIVSNDNNGLFSLQPTIGVNGNLSYTPAIKAFGTATVTVQFHDNGGTANNGLDTSPAQTLVIAVTEDTTLDSDGDGCTDTRELQTTPNSEKLGGRRDRNYYWDYFNPTRDRQNRIDDIEMVKDAYYQDYYLPSPPNLPNVPNPNYNPDTDRTFVGPNPWNTGPPDGLQRVDDILYAEDQYFHDCL